MEINGFVFSTKNHDPIEMLSPVQTLVYIYSYILVIYSYFVYYCSPVMSAVRPTQTKKYIITMHTRT